MRHVFAPRKKSPNLFFGLLLFIPLCCACLCGGSKNDRVDEETRILSTSTQAGRTATITYIRTNRRKKQHMDQLFKDSFYTTTEALWLTMDEPPDVQRYTLVAKSNREGEITMIDPKAAVELSPEGERVLYKHGDDAWRLFFLINDREFIAGAPDLLGTTRPDWSKTPTFSEYVTELFLLHHSVGSLEYSSINRKRILTHLGKTQGEPALIDFIFMIKDHPKNESNYFMEDAFNALSEGGKETMRERLIAQTLQHDPPRLEDLNMMLSLVDVSSPLLTGHVQRFATYYTSRRQGDRIFSSMPASQLLLEAARQDIALGHKLSCEMLTTHAPELARPGKEGWQMRAAALAIIAKSGIACPVVPSMISTQPCHNGYANEQGTLISREVATRTIEEEFAKGPLGKGRHRPQIDGHFVLAALWMTGQPLPDSLKDLRCGPDEP